MTRLSQRPESTTEITSAISGFICKELLQDSSIKLTQATPLIDAGYLTSLQAVELLMFLEERFQVGIEPEEVNEEQFRSVSTLTALVERKLREQT